MHCTAAEVASTAAVWNSEMATAGNTGVSGVKGKEMSGSKQYHALKHN